jgi:hypothetical protein
MAPLEIQSHTKLDKPLRFEMLLAEISTLFINLPVDRINSEIEAAQLRILGKASNRRSESDGPLGSWFDKTWKQGDFELVK